jgi:hypothetical protein
MLLKFVLLHKLQKSVKLSGRPGVHFNIVSEPDSLDSAKIFIFLKFLFDFESTASSEVTASALPITISSQLCSSALERPLSSLCTELYSASTATDFSTSTQHFVLLCSVHHFHNCGFIWRNQDKCLLS